MCLTQNKADMKTKATNTVFLLLVLMAMAGACKDKDTLDQAPGIAISLAKIPDNPDYISLPIIGTKWKLIGFVDSGANTIKLAEPSEGDTYTLIFEENGTVSGVTSTNQATGTYTLDGQGLHITTWGMTYINELYDGPLYLKAINKVYSYQLSAKGLILNYKPQQYLLYKPF